MKVHGELVDANSERWRKRRSGERATALFKRETEHLYETMKGVQV